MSGPLPSENVRTVFGLPLYNHAHQLRETLDSLANQTRGDFAVLMLDDGSTDETPEIARAMAAHDPRFHYGKNPSRLGYVGNANRAVEWSRELFPQADYFAWGSDHDLWHPRWLEALAGTLDANPAATLAWPHCLRIDTDGDILRRAPHSFDTAGIADGGARFRTTLRAMATGEAVAGNMIYGLFRRSALSETGPLPRLLLPDRVVILEAALTGPCLQVREPLWYRRYEALSSPARQRRSLFAGAPPLAARLPVWMGHAGHFLKCGRVTAALAYLTTYLPAALRHKAGLAIPRWQRQFAFAVQKPLGMWWHRTKKRLRGRVSGLRRRLRA